MYTYIQAYIYTFLHSILVGIPSYYPASSTTANDNNEDDEDDEDAEDVEDDEADDDVDDAHCCHKLICVSDMHVCQSLCECVYVSVCVWFLHSNL